MSDLEVCPELPNGDDAWWLADGVDLGPDLDDDAPVYLGLPFRRPPSAPHFVADPAFRWGSGFRACGLPSASRPLSLAICYGCGRCLDLGEHFGADFGASGVAPA